MTIAGKPTMNEDDEDVSPMKKIGDFPGIVMLVFRGVVWKEKSSLDSDVASVSVSLAWMSYNAI